GVSGEDIRRYIACVCRSEPRRRVRLETVRITRWWRIRWSSSELQEARKEVAMKAWDPLIEDILMKRCAEDGLNGSGSDEWRLPDVNLLIFASTGNIKISEVVRGSADANGEGEGGLVEILNGREIEDDESVGMRVPLAHNDSDRGMKVDTDPIVGHELVRETYKNESEKHVAHPNGNIARSGVKHTSLSKRDVLKPAHLEDISSEEAHDNRGCLKWPNREDTDASRTDMVEPSLMRGGLDEPCPFPPGFGPCTDQVHVHKSVGGEKRGHPERNENDGAEVIGALLDSPVESESESTPTPKNERRMASEVIQLCEDGGMSFKNVERELVNASVMRLETGSSGGAYTLRPRKSKDVSAGGRG
ncbi:hypothetical protein PIB30_041496, partial [Stylosanthes scabra]|nr:hypothetical protein [Stylosanthes scabra]